MKWRQEVYAAGAILDELDRVSVLFKQLGW